MTLYKNPYKTTESSAFDSPNAEFRFQKSLNSRFSETSASKIAESPRKPQQTAPFATENAANPEKTAKIAKKPLKIAKTDPIVQENARYHEPAFKSSVKIATFSQAETMNFEEKPRKVLKTGTFNQNYRGIAGEDSWKPLRKYVFRVFYRFLNDFRENRRFPATKSLQLPENSPNRRLLKENPQISLKYARNPILEGELPRKIVKNPAKTGEISRTYANFKEKLMFLPADRSTLPRKNAERPLDTWSFVEESTQSTKNSTTKPRFPEDSCKQLLSYEFALPFRNESFTKPVNCFGIEERCFLYADVNEKDFRRKALLGKYKE